MAQNGEAACRRQLHDLWRIARRLAVGSCRGCLGQMFLAERTWVAFHPHLVAERHTRQCVRACANMRERAREKKTGRLQL